MILEGFPQDILCEVFENYCTPVRGDCLVCLYRIKPRQVFWKEITSCSNHDGRIRYVRIEWGAVPDTWWEARHGVLEPEEIGGLCSIYAGTIVPNTLRPSSNDWHELLCK